MNDLISLGPATMAGLRGRSPELGTFDGALMDGRAFVISAMLPWLLL